jgi:lambda family phage portal protein
MSNTWLDRAIAYVAPGVGAERARQRAIIELAGQLDATLAARTEQPTIGAYTGETTAGGYRPQRRSWFPSRGDANADTLRQLPLQRGQSRDLARTHPIAVGALQTVVDRVVGTGLALVPMPNQRILGWSDAQVQQWKAQVQAEFSLWADSPECDITLAGNFYERQRLVLGSKHTSGDAFTILPDGQTSAVQPYKLRLQIIEADRVGNPDNATDTPLIAGGVKRASSGRPLSYFVYDQHPGAANAGAKGLFKGTWIDRVGATGRQRILHHWTAARPEQTRGVPWFAPIVALLRDLGDWTDSEVKAAVVSSFFTVFLTTPGGTAAPVFGAAAAPDGGDTVAMGPAAVIGLAPGEKPEFANPSRPNTAYAGFMEAICVQIGMALGMPYELLVKRFNASYSASKAALLDAWVFFRYQRTWLARSFCQPVYETWLAEAVAIGRVEAPGFFSDPLMRWAYCQAAWMGDSMGSINPKDEVAAYRDAIDSALMTHERAEWELWGSDWSATTPTKITEHKTLKDNDMLPVPKPGAAARPATAT